MPQNKKKGVGNLLPPLIFSPPYLKLLDQTKLPNKISYITIQNYKALIKAIKKLRVRGAPLIGVAAAYGIACEALRLKSKVRDKLPKVISEVKASRPTGFNLFWTLERINKILKLKLNNQELIKRITEEAKAIEKEEKERCEQIGEIGAGLLKKRARVLTICNTGFLATSGIGTALGVIYKAKEQGKDITVFVCETRPLLQGARLTTFELKREGIKTFLITDGMVGAIMPEIDIVLTGADRIARNGDFANKIGTLTLAICANYYKKPFYCVAPTSTIDYSLKTGKEIIIEERKEEEIIFPPWAKKPIAPRGIRVRNPAFDVTPHNLVTGIITEEGIITPPLPEGLNGGIYK